MVERGAFGALGARPVAGATYLGLGSNPKPVHAPLDEITPDQVWDELALLLAAYADPGRGFSARIAPLSDDPDREGDHDHLARRGEWDHSTPVTREEVGHLAGWWDE